MRGALGQLQILDGDPSDCLGVPHGSDCPGLLSRCICVDLRQEAVIEELKYLLWRAGNYAPSYAYSWTSADEANLMAWALDHGGDRNTLIQRSSTGVLYPTGDGLTQLAISAGCAQKTGDAWVGCQHGTLDALAVRALNGEGWLKLVPPIFRVVVPAPTPAPDPTPAPTPAPAPAPEPTPEPSPPEVATSSFPVKGLAVAALGLGVAWWIWKR